MKKLYDVIVIGAGPGGMTAALYASRSNLSVLMLDRGVYGGQMNNTSLIENYPGFSSILGPDLAENMYNGAIQFGAKFKYGNVENIKVNGAVKVVITDTETYETKAVVIAIGSEYRKLGVPGEDSYGGRGVSYCAVCDGAFFKGLEVVVIGGGDSALEEGLYLTQLVSQVTIIHRRNQFKAQKIIQDRVFKNDKINFVFNSTVQKVLGDDMKVTGVSVFNNQTRKEHTIETSGVFIYVGIIPKTEQFSCLGITNENGWIETNKHMETIIPGVYAIGDVREKDLRQITTAVGDGSIVGQQVFRYIESFNTNIAKNKL